MEALETNAGIRKFRDKIHFSQTDLARELDILPQNVSKWEAGNGTPSFQIARKLFEMGITVEELFGVEYEKKHNLVKAEISNDDLILNEIKVLKARVEYLEMEKKKPPAKALG